MVINNSDNTSMTFIQEFLNYLIPKIGPRGAVDLSRDAKTVAIQKILINKRIVTQEELNGCIKREFDLIAKTIIQTSLPTQTKIAPN